MLGAVLSITDTVKVQVFILLLPSIAVNVTVMLPRVETSLDVAGDCVTAGVTVQLSLVVARLV
jgi:hypothetical protein